MENPTQNSISIFLSCLNLNMKMNTNTDFFLLPGTTDTAEAYLAGVPLNKKKNTRLCEDINTSQTDLFYRYILCGGLFVIITQCV